MVLLEGPTGWWLLINEVPLYVHGRSWRGGTALKIQIETTCHPGGNPGANLKSISHRCYLQEVAFEWELT